jgi:hypothetical protein
MRVKPLLAVLASVVSAALSAPTAASGDTIIDTIGLNRGSVHSFGAPDIATFGQTVTVPATDTVLDSFTFLFAREADELTRITFRGEVYAWDGAKATGPSLWESAPRTVEFPSNDLREITFETGGVALVPGAQYVLFASVSKDYEQNTGRNRTGWGFLDQLDGYAGGGFVWLADSGDESRWTTDPWVVFPNSVDLAFKAVFSLAVPTSQDQCRDGGWRAYGIFKNQGDCVSFVATGGRNQPSEP